ncbi:hypothetical protein RN001_010681 [Aquatica leii]|uniref:Ketosynthase family 3 (KS3) domain-containing protein n=1 Tax=Aquatica leii TaxID=1421715 RepID=A0AAN7SQF6_9COLE|nr:hypothetical protein RN001_010681 [Aquatica leii]
MQQTNEKIIVSGIAGVFPNLNDVAELYTNLNNKIQSFNCVDPYWKVLTFGVSPVIGRLPFETKFDAGFFGVHQKQAEDMHHACRILLELAVGAVIDGSKTGVFVASSGIEPGNEWISHKLSSPNFGIVGSTWSTFAEWISYYFQLQGPSISIDSGCASSLYAVHQAVLAIRTGRCDNAIICGFNVIQNPYLHFALQQVGVLNTNGNGNVFDDLSNGYIRSEAMAVIFVQKLQNAKRIYAEILNIKTNCDGFKEMGIAHPSDEMIACLFQEVYDEVNVDPKTVTFVECHVAGTAVGISQETKAIEQVFYSDKKTPILVGSIKANIGHSEGACGLASLIKILIGLQHNCILPNPDYQNLSQNSDALQNGKIAVVTQRVSLPTDQTVIIGCTSFGFGGTNGHLALKHYNKLQHSKQLKNFIRLVCFSARTMSSIRKIIDSVKNNPTEEYLALLQNIFRIRKILLTKEVDILQLWNQKEELDFADYVFATVILQIVLTDLFKDLLQEKITIVYGFSSGVIASAYAQETLPLETVLFLAYELRSRLKTITNVNCMENEEIILREIKFVCEEKNTGICKLKVNVLKLFKNADMKLAPNVTKVVIGSCENNGQFSFNSNITLLHLLGRLYVLGFNLNLDKLYSSISWPIKAPLISPCIQWHHENDWHVPKFEMRSLSTHVVTMVLEHEHWKFLAGHIVDDRIVLPGAAYLSLAWNFYLMINRLSDQTKIVFEDVTFHRITFLVKHKPLTLTVNFMKVQKKFEINEGNDCLVTGRIRAWITDFELTINFKPTAKPKIVMRTEDIYKKLNLHGYSYTNKFCCLQEASLDGTTGLIKWNNWITFFDGMLQFPLLMKPLDDLYLPAKIERLTIDPQNHAQAITKHNNLLPITYELDSNVVSTPGVELRNIIFTNTKKHAPEEPILETYKFVPFDANFSLETSVKVHIQLVAENIFNTLNVIEVVDSFSTTTKLRCPIIDNVLKNEYPINKHLFVYSTNVLDCPNISIEYKTIDQLPFDTNLLVISGGSKRQIKIEQILQNHNGFILSRETLSFEKFKHAEVVLTHRTNSENLVMLRKSLEIPKRLIEVKSDFAWLEQLKLSLSQNEKVLLVAQNDPTSGILGLVCCLKQEVGQSVSCIFLPDCDKNIRL